MNHITALTKSLAINPISIIKTHHDYIVNHALMRSLPFTSNCFSFLEKLLRICSSVKEKGDGIYLLKLERSFKLEEKRAAKNDSGK